MLDVFDNVATRHPLRDGREWPLVHVPKNTEELQDVWMRQFAPKDGLLAESLQKNVSTWFRGGIYVFPTCLIQSKLLSEEILRVVTATRVPLCFPILVSVTSLPTHISSETSTSSLTVTISGSCL